MTIKAVGYINGIYNLYLGHLFDILTEYSDIRHINILPGGLKLLFSNKMWNTYNGEKGIIKRFFFTKINRINRIGPHNLDVISLLVGRLFGDRYASKRSEKGTRISFRQSIVHYDYLIFLYNYLIERGYCTLLSPRQYERKLKGSDKQYYGFEFNTLTFISLDFLRRLFYNEKGVKFVSPLLQPYLTPFALVIWFMDDGTYVKSSKSVRLARNSFTLREVELLVKMLNENFDLNFTIQKVSDKINAKHKYNLYLLAKDFNQFKAIVLPYMHNSMLYKLNL